MSIVTVVVPAIVSVIDMPPVVYPFALLCSFVRPAYVVEHDPMFYVDRNRAQLNVSESMSNVPLKNLARPALVNCHAPAAIASTSLFYLLAPPTCLAGGDHRAHTSEGCSEGGGSF